MTQANGHDATLPFTIQAQYVKDFSFENPNPLSQFSEKAEIQPSISVDIQAKADVVNNATFEVTLEIRIDAKRENEQMFLTELSYAGLVTIGNIEEKFISPLLMIHCPTLLFPFARNIIANATRDGGFQPLMLAPVDFAYLYQQQQEAVQNQERANA